MADRLVCREWHQSASGLARDPGCELLVGKIPQMERLAVDLNLGRPLPTLSDPTHAAMPRSRGPIAGDVLPIGGLAQGPQVFSTAVQAISIDVIALNAVEHSGEAKEFAVQADMDPPAPDALLADDIAIPVEMPVPLKNERGIRSVNQGICADLAAHGAQGDSNRRLVRHHDLPHRSRGVAPDLFAQSRGPSAARVVP